MPISEVRKCTSVYTVDDIHAMRISVAEQYSKMTPIEAENDFKAHVENAKRTMEDLRRGRKRHSRT